MKRQRRIFRSRILKWTLSNLRLREAIETMPDGFAVFDSEQCLVMANQAYLGVFRDFS